MNLRKDHCRNLHNEDDRERVNDTRRRMPSLAATMPHPSGAGTRPTPARWAPRKTGTSLAAALDYYDSRLLPETTEFIQTTLGNGYLGSRIDEERSEMRYLV